MSAQTTVEIPIPPYTRPAPTKEDLDYAPLAALDFSKFDRPGGKEELVEDLRRAISEVGFFFVTKSGIDDSEVLRQLAIGDAFLKQPAEVKLEHPCDFNTGRYFGFRSPKETYEGTSIKSQVEIYNIPKDTAVLADEADEQFKYQLLKPHRAEIKAFQEKLHVKVLDPILRLFALLLELPEDYFSAPHAFDQATEDHLRYMRYLPHTAEEYAQIKGNTTKGHTDFGLLTILFPQAVAGLQVQMPDGSYKYVKYIPDHITVNTAEVLTFLSGGYIKSTVHRVVQPQKDQSDVIRLGLLYFSRVANDYDVAIAPSPLLERLGLYDPAQADPNPPKGLEWGRARVKHTHLRTVVQTTTPYEPFRFGKHEVNLEYASPSVNTPVVPTVVPAPIAV